jgi:hypothetical protein
MARAFFGTALGRLIGALAVAALLLIIYRGWQEAEINTSRVSQAKAESCVSRAKAIMEIFGRAPTEQGQSAASQAIMELGKDCGPQLLPGAIKDGDPLLSTIAKPAGPRQCPPHEVWQFGHCAPCIHDDCSPG